MHMKPTAATFLGAMAILALSGCAADNRRGDDPLYGGNAAAPRNASANATPTRSPGTASLATNPRSSLSRDNRLAIDNRKSGGVQQASWNNTNNMTVEQLRERLNARGVTWQGDTEVREGKYTFRCSMPNPRNLAVNRHFEAEGPDEISAMTAVLQQIEKERY